MSVEARTLDGMVEIWVNDTGMGIAKEDQEKVFFAVEVSAPDSWDCPRCGLPANQDAENPPPPPKIEPYKTHLAYVKERRSETEAADILDEAVALLRSRRKAGEIIF